MVIKARQMGYKPKNMKVVTGTVDLPSPAEVVIRLSLATGKIISMTDEKGVPFQEEFLTEALIQEFGMHVESMPPVAEISTIECDKKPTGCVIITFPDGTKRVVW